jgi:hypothetical protein
VDTLSYPPIDIPLATRFGSVLQQSFKWECPSQRKFLWMLKSTEAGYCETCIKKAADVLLNEELSFVSLLEDIRKQLSQQYGVPYYEPAARIESSLY